jgi:uncharacterized HhH-GPD family protein
VTRVEVVDAEQVGPFSFRWPDGEEQFEGGWVYRLAGPGVSHRVRHGIGGRKVYGRQRVHTVTWVDGEVQVEGVEADDYPSTGALLSVLRRPDWHLVRSRAEVPLEYLGFHLVDHRREIEAKWSRNCIAVKIGEADLSTWGRHALLRMRLRAGRTAARSTPAPRDETPARQSLPPAPSLGRRAVAEALLAHDRALAASIGGGTVRFTPDADANAFIHADPFAFLAAVVADQGIKAERAWAIPSELRRRLGHLDPHRIAGNGSAVHAAFVQLPTLHRFPSQIASWVTSAGEIVVGTYGGDAERIWNDRPTAAALRARFDAFPGIGQKKAAMAVEILERDLKKPLSELSGSDIAYDVHVRRVFLRTGLADRDDVHHMVAAARQLHPDRPGELDNPAWDIGRRWCRPGTPDCPDCPLVGTCPRLVERAAHVKGI